MYKYVKLILYMFSNMVQNGIILYLIFLILSLISLTLAYLLYRRVLYKDDANVMLQYFYIVNINSSLLFILALVFVKFLLSSSLSESLNEYMVPLIAFNILTNCLTPFVTFYIKSNNLTDSFTNENYCKLLFSTNCMMYAFPIILFVKQTAPEEKEEDIEDEDKEESKGKEEDEGKGKGKGEGKEIIEESIMDIVTLDTAYSELFKKLKEIRTKFHTSTDKHIEKLNNMQNKEKEIEFYRNDKRIFDIVFDAFEKKVIVTWYMEREAVAPVLPAPAPATTLPASATLPTTLPSSTEPKLPASAALPTTLPSALSGLSSALSLPAGIDMSKLSSGNFPDIINTIRELGSTNVLIPSDFKESAIKALDGRNDIGPVQKYVVKMLLNNVENIKIPPDIKIPTNLEDKNEMTTFANTIIDAQKLGWKGSALKSALKETQGGSMEDVMENYRYNAKKVTQEVAKEDTKEVTQEDTKEVEKEVTKEVAKVNSLPEAKIASEKATEIAYALEDSEADNVIDLLRMNILRELNQYIDKTNKDGKALARFGNLPELKIILKISTSASQAIEILEEMNAHFKLRKEAYNAAKNAIENAKEDERIRLLNEERANKERIQKEKHDKVTDSCKNDRCKYIDALTQIYNENIYTGEKKGKNPDIYFDNNYLNYLNYQWIDDKDKDKEKDTLKSNIKTICTEKGISIDKYDIAELIKKCEEKIIKDINFAEGMNINEFWDKINVDFYWQIIVYANHSDSDFDDFDKIFETTLDIQRANNRQRTLNRQRTYMKCIANVIVHNEYYITNSNTIIDDTYKYIQEKQTNKNIYGIMYIFLYILLNQINAEGVKKNFVNKINKYDLYRDVMKTIISQIKAFEDTNNVRPMRNFDVQNTIERRYYPLHVMIDKIINLIGDFLIDLHQNTKLDECLKLHIIITHGLKDIQFVDLKAFIKALFNFQEVFEKDFPYNLLNQILKYPQQSEEYSININKIHSYLKSLILDINNETLNKVITFDNNNINVTETKENVTENALETPKYYILVFIIKALSDIFAHHEHKYNNHEKEKLENLKKGLTSLYEPDVFKHIQDNKQKYESIYNKLIQISGIDKNILSPENVEKTKDEYNKSEIYQEKKQTEDLIVHDIERRNKQAEQEKAEQDKAEQEKIEREAKEAKQKADDDAKKESAERVAAKAAANEAETRAKIKEWDKPQIKNPNEVGILEDIQLRAAEANTGIVGAI